MKKRIIKKKPSKSAKKYAMDTVHAEKMKQRSIRNYRKTKGASFELTGSVVKRALDFLDGEAATLPVFNSLTKRTASLPVIRLTHAAKLLNVSYQTLWRWSSETEQLPMPVLTDNSHGREYAVYHLEEIRVMIRTLGDHLNQYRYYRTDHTATREKVFAEIQALRANNYNTLNGDTTNGNSQKRRKPIQKLSRKNGNKPSGA